MKRCFKRFEKVLNQLHAWQKSEATTIRLHRRTRQILVKRFLFPSTNFGIHIIDVSPRLLHLAYKLESRVVAWIFHGRGGNYMARARSLFRLPTLSTRRFKQQCTRLLCISNLAVLSHWTPAPSHRTQETALKNYLLSLSHPSFSKDIKKLQLVEAGSTKPRTNCEARIKNLKSDALATDWAVGNLCHRRPIPLRNLNLPAYSTESSAGSDLADKWYLGRLPTLPSSVYSTMEHIMTLNHWNSSQVQKYTAICSDILPSQKGVGNP